MPPGGLGGLVPCWAWLACLLPACCLVCLLGPGCLQLAGYLPGFVWPACWMAWVAWAAKAHKTRSIYQKGMRQGMRQYAPNHHVTLAPGLAGWLA